MSGKTALQCVMADMWESMENILPHTIAIARAQAADLPGLFSNERSDFDDYVEAQKFRDVVLAFSAYAHARLCGLSYKTALIKAFSSMQSTRTEKPRPDFTRYETDTKIIAITDRRYNTKPGTDREACRSYWRELALAATILREEMKRTKNLAGGHLRAFGFLARAFRACVDDDATMRTCTSSLPRYAPESDRMIDLAVWLFQKAAQYQVLEAKIRALPQRDMTSDTLDAISENFNNVVHTRMFYTALFHGLCPYITTGDPSLFLCAGFLRLSPEQGNTDSPQRHGPIRDFELLEKSIVREAKFYLTDERFRKRADYNPEAAKAALNRILHDLAARQPG